LFPYLPFTQICCFIRGLCYLRILFITAYLGTNVSQ